ncbi:DUF402 domain-containing protein [Alicyclobacillus pomorum]|jgi:protein associated with RNAse G/E|uniref:DUF402 domain-containing protein n=1 Tax=Alicyclobacillus pomorum TaxID=204470 RepID=UPI0004193768|nr:DUF402 domain-containing protein [Alicyclobacillus pomorum]
MHRIWPEVYATDEPWAFFIPANTPVQEEDGRQWSSPYPVVALFWPKAYYQVFILLKPQATEYYCNVIAPLCYLVDRQTVVFTDLDVDVMVTATGVEVLDEDEYEVRKGSYPPRWCAGVMDAKAELVALAKQQRGPFSPATANRWRAYVRSCSSQ